MKKNRVNWAAAMSAITILMGIGGIVAFGIAAGVTENMWWLIGCVPAIVCFGIGVGLLAEA